MTSVILKMDSATSGSNTPSSDRAAWNILGKPIPKQEVVYFCQIILIYIVVITSIVNISLQKDEGKVWTALLSSCLGYLLPNPSIKAPTFQR